MPARAKYSLARVRLRLAEVIQVHLTAAASLLRVLAARVKPLKLLSLMIYPAQDGMLGHHMWMTGFETPMNQKIHGQAMIVENDGHAKTGNPQTVIGMNYPGISTKATPSTLVSSGIMLDQNYCQTLCKAGFFRMQDWRQLSAILS